MSDVIVEAQQVVQDQLHSIIDELHPLFRALSDEELVEDNDEHGVFERTFAHKNKKIFKMRWRVFYGTPETVQTVFEPAEHVGFVS